MRIKKIITIILILGLSPNKIALINPINASEISPGMKNAIDFGLGLTNAASYIPAGYNWLGNKALNALHYISTEPLKYPYRIDNANNMYDYIMQHDTYKGLTKAISPLFEHDFIKNNLIPTTKVATATLAGATMLNTTADIIYTLIKWKYKSHITALKTKAEELLDKNHRLPIQSFLNDVTVQNIRIPLIYKYQAFFNALANKVSQQEKTDNTINEYLDTAKDTYNSLTLFARITPYFSVFTQPISSALNWYNLVNGKNIINTIDFIKNSKDDIKIKGNLAKKIIDRIANDITKSMIFALLYETTNTFDIA